MNDELTRYRAKIAHYTQRRDAYRALAMTAIKPHDRATFNHSADSLDRMIATHEGKVAELEAVTRGQQAA